MVDDRALWWGAADLPGAYHAGVLAALVTAAWALQRNGYDLRLDAIGGASSSANVRLRGRRKAR